MPNNFNYEKVKRKVFSVLEEFNEELEVPEKLFSAVEKTLREVE